MDEINPITETPWESPLKKFWDVLMFRRFVLPEALAVLNILAITAAVILTVMQIFGMRIVYLLLIWVYVVMLRIASELVLLLYRFLHSKCSEPK